MDLFLIAIAILIGAAIAAVLFRIIREWPAAKTTAVGGIIIAGLAGLLVAVIQTLVQGPGL